MREWVLALMVAALGLIPPLAPGKNVDQLKGIGEKYATITSFVELRSAVDRLGDVE